MAAIYCQGVGIGHSRWHDGRQHSSQLAAPQDVQEQSVRFAMGRRWTGHSKYISDSLVCLLGCVSTASQVLLPG